MLIIKEKYQIWSMFIREGKHPLPLTPNIACECAIEAKENNKGALFLIMDREKWNSNGPNRF